MMRSMFSAIGGLKAHQTMLDVTANDIANVNTIGFKGERASFKDALSQMVSGASAPTTTLGGANASQIGLGVQVGSIDNLMGAGATQSTGNVSDLAIQGEGWFRITDDPAAFGRIYYSRAGNFSRDATGTLVTPEGYNVVGYSVNSGTGVLTAPTAQTKITIDPATYSSYSIDQSGLVSAINNAGTKVYIAKVSMAKFPNESGLQRVSGNKFRASDNTGTPVTNDSAAVFGSLMSGAVEMSNVDLAQEFTSMITAQRGFQANSRVISTADDVLQELVNLKR